ncbi:alpha/beta-Hydrolases superfamily protein, partial [Striga asiatica]
MEVLRESRYITTAGQKESSAGAEEEEENPAKIQFGRCEEEENMMFSRDDDTVTLMELNDFVRQLHKKKLIDVLSFCETKATPIVEGYGGWAFHMEIVPILDLVNS